MRLERSRVSVFDEMVILSAKPWLQLECLHPCDGEMVYIFFFSLAVSRVVCIDGPGPLHPAIWFGKQQPNMFCLDDNLAQ